MMAFFMANCQKRFLRPIYLKNSYLPSKVFCILAQAAVESLEEKNCFFLVLKERPKEAPLRT